jgi:hypothetical protein
MMCDEHLDVCKELSKELRHAILSATRKHPAAFSSRTPPLPLLPPGLPTPTCLLFTTWGLKF